MISQQEPSLKYISDLKWESKLERKDDEEEQEVIDKHPDGDFIFRADLAGKEMCIREAGKLNKRGTTSTQLWMSSLSESRSLSGLVDRQSRKLPTTR